MHTLAKGQRNVRLKELYFMQREETKENSMKLPIEEFIENVKEELLCYEDMAELFPKWEQEFQIWLDKNKGKHKDIVVEKGSTFFKINDEEEIFEVAESYLDALEEGSVKLYWEKF